jgi:hypothetical protein
MDYITYLSMEIEGHCWNVREFFHLSVRLA